LHLLTDEGRETNGSRHRNMSRTNIAIIGGGIVGLSIARELLGRGADVTVFERGKVGREASYVAGGMLAASAEMGFEEFDLYRLCAESLSRWSAYASGLSQETGVDVDYRSEGSLIVAEDRDAAEALRRAYEFQRGHGFKVEWHSAAEALDIEPFLSPRIAAAVYAPEDHAVDNRKVIHALAQSVETRGGTIREDASVAAVDRQPGGGMKIRLEDDSRVSADTVVLAAGPWSRSIDVIPDSARPPVRPVKGQLLELRMKPPFQLRHVVRSSGAYLVPRTDGRLIVGATSEEMGFDTEITAGGLYSILDKAWEVVPGIYDLPVLDTLSGLRPGSRDHQPIVGWSGVDGLFIATGHYRHGILLSVVTAEESASMIMGGETPDILEPFSPLRFDMNEHSTSVS